MTEGGWGRKEERRAGCGGGRRNVPTREKGENDRRKEREEGNGGCKENVKAMEDGEKSEKGGKMRDRRVKRCKTVGR